MPARARKGSKSKSDATSKTAGDESTPLATQPPKEAGESEPTSEELVHIPEDTEKGGVFQAQRSLQETMLVRKLC